MVAYWVISLMKYLKWVVDTSTMGAILIRALWWFYYIISIKQIYYTNQHQYFITILHKILDIIPYLQQTYPSWDFSLFGLLFVISFPPISLLSDFWVLRLGMICYFLELPLNYTGNLSCLASFPCFSPRSGFTFWLFYSDFILSFILYLWSIWFFSFCYLSLLLLDHSPIWFLQLHFLVIKLIISNEIRMLMRLYVWLSLLFL